jgi:hypothetical protein
MSHVPTGMTPFPVEVKPFVSVTEIADLMGLLPQALALLRDGSHFRRCEIAGRDFTPSRFVSYWLLMPATCMQMLVTVSLSLHVWLVLLQYAHFSGLFNWMCRNKSAASDRFVSSWLSQHFQSEESFEKFLTWTAGTALCFGYRR